MNTAYNVQLFVPGGGGLAVPSPDKRVRSTSASQQRPRTVGTTSTVPSNTGINISTNMMSYGTISTSSQNQNYPTISGSIGTGPSTTSNKYNSNIAPSLAAAVAVYGSNQRPQSAPKWKIRATPESPGGGNTSNNLTTPTKGSHNTTTVVNAWGSSDNSNQPNGMHNTHHPQQQQQQQQQRFHSSSSTSRGDPGTIATITNSSGGSDPWSLGSHTGNNTANMNPNMVTTPTHSHHHGGMLLASPMTTNAMRPSTSSGSSNPYISLNSAASANNYNRQGAVVVQHTGPYTNPTNTSNPTGTKYAWDEGGNNNSSNNNNNNKTMTRPGTAGAILPSTVPTMMRANTSSNANNQQQHLVSNPPTSNNRILTNSNSIGASPGNSSTGSSSQVVSLPKVDNSNSYASNGQQEVVIPSPSSSKARSSSVQPISSGTNSNYNNYKSVPSPSSTNQHPQPQTLANGQQAFGPNGLIRTASSGPPSRPYSASRNGPGNNVPPTNNHMGDEESDGDVDGDNENNIFSGNNANNGTNLDDLNQNWRPGTAAGASSNANAYHLYGQPITNTTTNNNNTNSSNPTGGSTPTMDFSNLPPEEAEAQRRALQRQLQREREWLARQKLKAYVAQPEFDSRATTDFYGFGKVLGQGSFGEVRLAWHRLAGSKVAIKSYEKSKLTEPNHWRRVQQEIRLMERLNHPHIIRQLEMIDSPKRIHIVMEYAGGGNLCSYVKAKQRLNEAEARKIFLQLLAAVEYMHENSIIHRDIKLENVLFDEEQANVKLTDFGFSVMVRDPMKRLKIFCGTPSYMAPEITQRREYLGRPVDVWSLAVLLYACLAGHFPFTAKTYPELYKKIGAAQVKFPDHISPAVKDLLRRMLHPDPMKRLILAHARMHPWVAPSLSIVMMAISAPAERSLLISDDPSKDVNEAVLQRCEQLGYKRNRVLEAVLSRTKNACSTTYYLILARVGRGAKAVPSSSSNNNNSNTGANSGTPINGSTPTFNNNSANTNTNTTNNNQAALLINGMMQLGIQPRPATAVTSGTTSSGRNNRSNNLLSSPGINNNGGILGPGSPPLLPPNSAFTHFSNDNSPNHHSSGGGHRAALAVRAARENASSPLHHDNGDMDEEEDTGMFIQGHHPATLLHGNTNNTNMGNDTASYGMGPVTWKRPGTANPLAQGKVVLVNGGNVNGDDSDTGEDTMVRNNHHHHNNNNNNNGDTTYGGNGNSNTNSPGDNNNQRNKTTNSNAGVNVRPRSAVPLGRQGNSSNNTVVPVLNIGNSNNGTVHSSNNTNNIPPNNLGTQRRPSITNNSNNMNNQQLGTVTTWSPTKNNDYNGSSNNPNPVTTSSRPTSASAVRNAWSSPGASSNVVSNTTNNKNIAAPTTGTASSGVSSTTSTVPTTTTVPSRIRPGSARGEVHKPTVVDIASLSSVLSGEVGVSNASTNSPGSQSNNNNNLINGGNTNNHNTNSSNVNNNSNNNANNGTNNTSNGNPNSTAPMSYLERIAAQQAAAVSNRNSNNNPSTTNGSNMMNTNGPTMTIRPTLGNPSNNTYIPATGQSSTGTTTVPRLGNPLPNNNNILPITNPNSLSPQPVRVMAPNVLTSPIVIPNYGNSNGNNMNGNLAPNANGQYIRPSSAKNNSNGTGGTNRPSSSQGTR